MRLQLLALRLYVTCAWIKLITLFYPLIFCTVRGEYKLVTVVVAAAASADVVQHNVQDIVATTNSSDVIHFIHIQPAKKQIKMRLEIITLYHYNFSFSPSTFISL